MKRFTESSLYKTLIAVLGGVLFAFSYRIFIVPLHLMSGGFTGISQLILRFITFVFHVTPPSNIDVTGIIVWLLNIPLFIMVWKIVSPTFMLRTFLTVLVQSACMVWIPAPAAPLMDNTRTCVLLGGAIAGFGVGITLKNGGCGGGIDTVGIYSAKKFPEFSVGKLSLFVNGIIYVICAFSDGPEIAVYSVLYTFVECLVMDRIHEQNIMTQAIIVTRSNNFTDEIIHHLNRGCTVWDGSGGYDSTPTHIIMTTVSRYERRLLDQKVQELDPHAFVTYQDGVSVTGNFEKRFDA